MKNNKIKNNDDGEEIVKTYEPEQIVKLLDYISKAIDSWLKQKKYNAIPISEDVVDDSGFAYLNISKDNIKFMKIIMKSYYIHNDYKIGGNNEKQ